MQQVRSSGSYSDSSRALSAREQKRRGNECEDKTNSRANAESRSSLIGAGGEVEVKTVDRL